MIKFIRVTTGNFIMVHGFDAQNQQIEEEVQATPTEKLIAIDRILSISEKYILTRYTDDRLIYYEYEGKMEDIAHQLMRGQLL